MRHIAHLPAIQYKSTRSDSGVPMRKGHVYELDIDQAAEYITELQARVTCAERHADDAIETSRVLAAVWVLTVLSAAVIIVVMALT